MANIATMAWNSTSSTLRDWRDALRAFLLQQFDGWTLEEIIPPNFAWEGLRVFAYLTVLPCLLFVFVTPHVAGDHWVARGLEQVKGPHVWNFFGTPGLFAFAVTLLIARASCFSKWSYRLLRAAHGVGSLTLGVLCGEWVLLTNDGALPWWQYSFWSSTILMLLVTFMFFNTIVLWLACLMKSDAGKDPAFVVKLRQMNVLSRLGIGTLIIGLLVVY